MSIIDLMTSPLDRITRVVVPVNGKVLDQVLVADMDSRVLKPISASLEVTNMNGTLVTPTIVSIGTNAPLYNNITTFASLGVLNAIGASVSIDIEKPYMDITDGVYANVTQIALGVGLTNYTLNLTLNGKLQGSS